MISAPGLAFLASSFGVSNGAGSETAHIYEGLENASNLLALSLTNSPNAPRAYLMCMVFDQDYVLIDPTAGGYDFYAPVPEAAATETQNISLEIDIPENAKYIYTYLANESAGTDVFFDDFTVSQLGVDIAQETDYYPGGSIASHWQKENYRFGYQGDYSEEDEETGFNQFEARLYDSKILRWTSTDPAGQFYSPYNGMGNNPVNGVDPDGRLFGKLRAQISAFFSGGSYYKDDLGNWIVNKTNVSFSGDNEVYSSSGVVYGTAAAWEVTSTTKNFGQSGFRGRAESVNIQFANFNVAERIAFRSGGLWDVWAAWASRDPLGIRNGAPGVRQPPNLMKAIAGANPNVGLYNGLKSVFGDTDIYGESTTSTGKKIWAGIDAATAFFPYSKIKYLQGAVYTEKSVKYGKVVITKGNIADGVNSSVLFIHDLAGD